MIHTRTIDRDHIQSQIQGVEKEQGWTFISMTPFTTYTNHNGHTHITSYIAVFRENGPTNA